MSCGGPGGESRQGGLEMGCGQGPTWVQIFREGEMVDHGSCEAIRYDVREGLCWLSDQLERWNIGTGGVAVPGFGNFVLSARGRCVRVLVGKL